MFSFITDGNFIVFRFTETDVLRSEHDRYRLHNTSKCIDWALPEDTTRITFTIDEGRYENIPLSSIDFDGDVCDVQQDFIDGVQGMFENLAPGEGGAASYLVYTALLNQSGSSGPVATVLGDNTIGNIVWTRNVEGNYSGTLNASFPAAKSFLIIQNMAESNLDEGNKEYRISRSGNDGVSIFTADAGAFSDDLLINTSIEIRVYP